MHALPMKPRAMVQSIATARSTRIANRLALVAGNSAVVWGMPAAPLLDERASRVLKRGNQTEMNKSAASTLGTRRTQSEAFTDEASIGTNGKRDATATNDTNNAPWTAVRWPRRPV